MPSELKPVTAPAELAGLDGIADDWAPLSESGRRERRASASMAELRDFYDRLGPLVPVIAKYLDAFSVDAPLGAREDRLLRLAQMYMESAWAVEGIGQPEEADQVPRARWHITPVLQRASWRKP